MYKISKLVSMPPKEDQLLPCNDTTQHMDDRIQITLSCGVKQALMKKKVESIEMVD